MIYTKKLEKKLNEALVIDWSIEWQDRNTDFFEPYSKIITTWMEREAGSYTVFGFVGMVRFDGTIDFKNADAYTLEIGVDVLMNVYKRCMALETFWKSEYPEYVIA